ncbi:MAG: hypothetical protein HY647_06535 [Acidobacteria bacterium]|nr:hypothetical protein [Acidobacteriota bacterium]
MRDQLRIRLGLGSRPARRGKLVRSGCRVPKGRLRSAPWSSLATAGIVLVLTLGRASNRAWAQHEQHQPPQSAPARSRPADAPPPPPGMSYTTYLDHTAVWVGDQFHYTIAVDHSPDYEFVLDTLSKETMNLEPFQVMDLSTRTVPLKGGSRRLYVDLTLADYTTGKASEQIPQISLFYFRRDQRTTSAQEAAAESLTVPGPLVGLRTTLPPSPQDIRDAVTVSGWERSRWWLAGAGVLSLFVLLVGAGWETAQFVKRRKARKGPDRRKAMAAVCDRWATSVPADFSNTEAVIEFYNRCDHDIKEYLGYYLETSALGLTAEEMEGEMQRLGTDAGFAEKVVRTVRSLETARYSRNGTAPTREAAEGIAQEVREIFAFSSKP